MGRLGERLSGFEGVIAVAVVRLAAHLALGNRYGFHRDELATLSDSLNLAWGYVAYPPVTPLLGRLGIELFGIEPLAVRWIAAFAQAVIVLLAGSIAAHLGASRRGQTVAAIAVAIAPLSMLQGVLFQYVSFDMLWWTLLGWLAIRLAKDDEPLWWVPIGAVIGLGMMTKYSILFLVAGIVVGTIATPLRRHLSSPWLWGGVGLSLLIYLPNLLWQIQNDFISVDFLQAISERDRRIGRSSGFLSDQFTTAANMFTAPLWIAGAWWLLISRAGKRYRIAGFMWLVPLVLFMFARGRAYYMAGATPLLLAAGAMVWDRAMTDLVGWKRVTLGAVTALLLIVGTVGICVISLPIGEVNSRAWQIASDVHDNFEEQIGWDDLVVNVANVYERLSPEEKAHAGIVAGNYGEAGAIYLFGRDRGLPEPISGVNSWWARGYGEGPQIAIVVGVDREDASRIFEQCDVAAINRNRFGVINEESRDHPEILLCRRTTVPWSVIWPEARGFG